MGRGIEAAIRKNKEEEQKKALLMDVKQEKLKQKTEEETRAAWAAEKAKDDATIQARVKNIYAEIRKHGNELSDQLKETRDRINVKAEELEDMRANISRLRTWKEKVGGKAEMSLDAKNEKLGEATKTLEEAQKLLGGTVAELDRLRNNEATMSEKRKDLMEEAERIQAGQMPSEKIYRLIPGLVNTEANVKSAAGVAAEYGGNRNDSAENDQAAEAAIEELQDSRLGANLEEFLAVGNTSASALDQFKGSMIDEIIGAETVSGLTAAELQELKNNAAWSGIQTDKESSPDTAKMAHALRTRIEKGYKSAMERRKYGKKKS